jgi:hypothetical protein
MRAKHAGVCSIKGYSAPRARTGKSSRHSQVWQARCSVKCPAGASISSASALNVSALLRPPNASEAILEAIKRFEIPPERQNRVTVEKMTKDKD